MFVKKLEAELEKLTPAELDQYRAEKEAFDQQQIDNKIAETKSAFELEVKENKKQVSELKEQLNQLKESGNSSFESTDIFEAIEKSLVDFLPKVKAAKQAAGAESPFDVEMTIKAPINMTTGAVTNNVATPVNYVYNQVTNYAEDVRKREYIINYLSVGSTNKPSLPYMDKLPTEGTMAITAEGALKPLISISFTLRYSQAVKVAGRTKISEEALDDIPFIMSMIKNELMYQHDIAVQTAIFDKVTEVAPGFVAGALAFTTAFPSNWDAVRSSIYAVKIQSKGLYTPNAVLISSSDAYAMGATKDANRNYVIPTFVLPDGTRISGVQVIEDPDGETVPAGTFIVGDWTKLHYDRYKTFTIRIGQGIVGNATAANIVSDFESNMYTMIGESRFHLWIYENEKLAFVRATFASVKTAIASN